MRQSALEELLAVVAAQVVVHVHECPVPVDAGQAEFADVGQEGVGECAALAGEPVGTARHPVADREVALLLAHGDQCRCELDGSCRVEGGQQRELRAVDVPHGREVEHERSVRWPERALVGREARLDQRVVQRGGEHGLAFARRRLDADRAEVVGPAGTGGGTTLLEARPVGPAVGVEVRAGLFDAAQGETEAEFDGLTRPCRSTQQQPERAQGGRTDRIEVELGSARHQTPVVPEHLAPVGVIALDVDGERRALDDHLALGDAGLEGPEVRPRRHGAAVLDRQPTE